MVIKLIINLILINIINIMNKYNINIIIVGSSEKGGKLGEMRQCTEPFGIRA